MKLIQQRHKTGCGAASLAMLMNVSYYEALDAIHPNREKNSKKCVNVATDYKEMLHGIERLDGDWHVIGMCRSIINGLI